MMKLKTCKRMQESRLFRAITNSLYAINTKLRVKSKINSIYCNISPKGFILLINAYRESLALVLPKHLNVT